MPTRDWKGMYGFSPRNLEKEDPETCRKYEALTRLVGYKLLDTEGNLRPWESRHENTMKPFTDSYGSIIDCGRHFGIVFNCECGAEFGFPFGCRDKFCLNCQGVLAAKLAAKIQLKTDRLHQDEDFVWGQVVFTVHPDHWPYCSSKEGANTMQKRAFETTAEVLGVPKTNLAAFTNFHSTSSKRPWLKRPHVHLTWAHANVGNEGIVPLETNEKGVLKPIQLDFMNDVWQEHYPGSENLHVSYKKELHFRHLRYQVRPMADDVFYAIQAGRLDVVENGTIPAIAEVGLRAKGGVEFWKGFHRVRHFGAFANNRFNRLMMSLGKHRIVQPKTCIECPDCEDGILTVERTDEGNRTVSLSPYHEPEIDYIMSTTCKSNSRKGDQAHV